LQPVEDECVLGEHRVEQQQSEQSGGQQQQDDEGERHSRCSTARLRDLHQRQPGTATPAGMGIAGPAPAH